MTELFNINYRPIWAILMPLLVSLFILFAGKRPNIRETGTIIGSIALCLIVLSMSHTVLTAGPILFSVCPLFPGIGLIFRVMHWV